MKLPTGYEDYPPRWHVLDQLGPSMYPSIGFARDLPFARRFGARYRFAKSVKEVVLTGYTSSDTCAGYSALTRLAFTYSAFETMLALVGLPRKGTHTILKSYPVSKWLKELTAVDPKYALFRFVAPRVGPNHERTNVLQFVAGRSCDVTALAAALRHIFFHGELTPNAGGIDPRIVSQICEKLIEILFVIMGHQVDFRLAAAERLARANEEATSAAEAARAKIDDIPF